MIELLVVLAVFMVIIIVTVGLFISIVQHQRGILTEQELLNQASYFTEYMSRTIRVAVKDTTGSCLSNSGNIYLLTHPTLGYYNGIKFITENNVCQEFFLDSDGILKEIKNGSQPQNILSGKFQVKYLRFIINGNKNLDMASENDLIQPRITFVLNIKKLPNQITRNKFNPFVINIAQAMMIPPPPPMPPPPPPPPPPTQCGNGVCEALEDCSSCSFDCGTCKPPPPPPPPLPPPPPPPADNQQEIIIQTTVSQINLNI